MRRTSFLLLLVLGAAVVLPIAARQWDAFRRTGQHSHGPLHPKQPMGNRAGSLCS